MFLINTCVKVMSLNEDLCGTIRVDLERHFKEKTMGRPINKNKIGQGAGRIQVTTVKFAAGSEIANAWIVSQRSTTKFIVSDGTKTETCTLVNKNTGALGASEFNLYATLDDSTVVQVTKLYNRKIQYEGGTANVDTIKYNVGPGDENDDTTGTATLPVQD